jgi:hypothetical protein
MTRISSSFLKVNFVNRSPFFWGRIEQDSKKRHQTATSFVNTKCHKGSILRIRWYNSAPFKPLLALPVGAIYAGKDLRFLERGCISLRAFSCVILLLRQITFPPFF